MPRDTGIDTLLDLNGTLVDQESCYWVKIEAWRVDISGVVPHGIRYSLTLHEPSGARILGYDNAHGVKPGGRFRYAGRVLPFDHRHRHALDDGLPYEFESAHRLLVDFFADIDRILREVRQE